MSRPGIGVAWLVSIAALAGCSGRDPAALRCPAGTRVAQAQAGSVVERWCERADGTRHGGFVRQRGRKVVVTGAYVNGQKHGVWHRHVSPGFSAFYVMTHGTGTEIEWTNVLRKTREAEIVNGRRHGAYTEWHPNRTIKIVGRYVDGKKDGRWWSFDGQGKLVSEARYASGVVVD